VSPRLLTPLFHSALRAACSPYGGTDQVLDHSAVPFQFLKPLLLKESCRRTDTKKSVERLT